MTLDINRFKAKFLGGARPNRFQVLVNFPSYAGGDSEKTSFMVRAAGIPGVAMGELPITFRGRSLPYPGDTTFEAWTITVLNDTDFGVHDAMVAWKNGINNNETNSADADISEWFTDIIVEQLGRTEGEVLKRFKLVSAYPESIGAITLDNETDGYETFEVTFKYLSWTAV